MSQGEAAEQVVNAMTNVAIKGMECVSNLAGKGALNLATFLIAVIKEEKRTKGKASMRVFNGKPTKVFVIIKECLLDQYAICYLLVLLSAAASIKSAIRFRSSSENTFSTQFKMRSAELETGRGSPFTT